MIGIKFLFDLMAAKIAQIDSDFDWLNSTHCGHRSHIYELQKIHRKRPVDFIEPTGTSCYNRTVNLVLPLFRI